MSEKSSLDTVQQPNRVFPLEIFELIFDAIVPDKASQTEYDCKALQHLCLVCKDFACLARPYLFYSAYVGTCPYLRRLTNCLLKVLSNQPCLRKFLRRLTFAGPSQWQIDAAGEIKDAYPFTHDPSVFLNLNRLEDLSLSGGRTIYGDTSPNDFGLPSLMETYLASGNLTKLHIQCVKELPIDLIVFSPALKILEIKSCELAPAQSSQLVPACRLIDLTLYEVKNVPVFTILNPEGCSELRSLSLILCEPAGGHVQPKENWNAAVHAFSELKSMTLDAFEGTWMFFQAATRAIGGVSAVFPSLKDFDMKMLDDLRTPHFSVYDEMLEFSVFPKLETLNIEGCQSAIDIFHLHFGQCVKECRRTLKKLVVHWDLQNISNPEYAIEALEMEFAAIPPGNSIEHIEIFIQAGIASTRAIPDVDAEVHDPDFETWRGLEDLLLQHPIRFPRLRSVSITTQFHLQDSEEFDPATAKKLCINFDESQWDRLKELYTAMKRLRASEDIQCNYRVDIFAPYLCGFTYRLNPDPKESAELA